MKWKGGVTVTKLAFLLVLLLLVLHAGIALLDIANRTLFHAELARAWAAQNERLEWIGSSLASMEARGAFDNAKLEEVWWGKVLPSLCTVNAPLEWWEEIGVP